MSALHYFRGGSDDEDASGYASEDEEDAVAAFLTHDDDLAHDYIHRA